MLEKTLKNRLKAKWKPAHFCIVENSVSSGLPDLCVIKSCRVQWIELKRLINGKYLYIRPLQVVWMNRALKQGHDTYIVWYEDNLFAVPWSCVSRWDTRLSAAGKPIRYTVGDQGFLHYTFEEASALIFRRVYK